MDKESCRGDFNINRTEFVEEFGSWTGNYEFIKLQYLRFLRKDNNSPTLNPPFFFRRVESKGERCVVWGQFSGKVSGLYLHRDCEVQSSPGTWRRWERLGHEGQDGSLVETGWY